MPPTNKKRDTSSRHPNPILQQYGLRQDADLYALISEAVK